jgi:hypothetical protein
MPHTPSPSLTGLLVAALALSLSGCGENFLSPSSPTSDTSPSAASNAPPGLSLATVSLIASSVLSQQSTQGSVTLNGSAPAGGALVSLSSSNPDVAKVPSSVTVAAGTSEARFAIDAATVPITTDVSIRGSYGGATGSASLAVRPPTVTAAFQVISTARGRGACVLGPSSGEADCVLDGTSSIGPVERWVWTYWTANAPIGHSSTQGRSGLNLASRCSFFEGGRGATDQGGDRYVEMEVELYVMDREGTRSASIRQPVRMYPNRMCGFSY